MKIIFKTALFGFPLFFLFACGGKPINSNDLIIDPNKIETFFSYDTAYDLGVISIYPKYNIDSFKFKPYEIGFNFKKSTEGKEGQWQLDFSISHYFEYCSVFPTKGNLKIDDYEFTYDLVNIMNVGSENSTIFQYTTLNMNEPEDSIIIEKIANAKSVIFTAIGHDKKEFIWSPKIINDAKNTLKYFNKIKGTKPTFK